MFEYIKGNYEEQASDYIVVDHQGMGYRINVSANTMSELPKLHKEVKVYIHPAFKEDDVTLYGFSFWSLRTNIRILLLRIRQSRAPSKISERQTISLTKQLTGCWD